MVVYAFNPSSQGAEVGGSLEFIGQPGLQNKFRDSLVVFYHYQATTHNYTFLYIKFTSLLTN